jgi:LytS/YehU family sensor histidine kinase
MTIRITARHETGPALEIVIANTGEWVSTTGEASVPSLGIGLENLRQRLSRYYPNRHEFTHAAQDGWVVARLRLLQAETPAVSSPTSVPRHG